LLQLIFFNSRTLCIFTLSLITSLGLGADTNSIPNEISVGLVEKLKFTLVPPCCMMIGSAKDDCTEMPLAL